MSERIDVRRFDRRDFLKATASLGGALIVNFSFPLTVRPAVAQVVGPPAFMPNAFIRIDRQNVVTLVMPMVEMGQGIYTAMAMLLAEELEVDVGSVRLEHAPPDDALYANSLLHIQTTGLSASVRGFWEPLRYAGAVARTWLTQAAAKEWNVDPTACQARGAAVTHVATARRLTYAELIDAAQALPMPGREAVALKRPDDFRVIGTPVKRLEAAAKVSGQTEFGIDVTLPGMKVAAVAISPVVGGRLRSLNESAARAVKGVRQVITIDEAVFVVGDHLWAALKGLRAATIQWEDGPNGSVDHASLVRQLEESSRNPGVVARNEGDARQALASAAQRLDAIYQLPFLAHAAMEPMNCTVDYRNDACDIWVGTQAPTLTQALVAELTGLPKDKIRVHITIFSEEDLAVGLKRMGLCLR